MSLTWTSTPPDRPGWYWLGFSEHPPRVVEVVSITDRLVYRTADVPRYLCRVNTPGVQWAGPIPEPTNPPARVPCPACVGEGYPAGRVPLDAMVRHSVLVPCRRCDGFGEVTP